MKEKILEVAALIPKFDVDSVQDLTPELFRYFFDKKKFPALSYLLSFQEDKKFYTTLDLSTSSTRLLIALSILLYFDKISQEELFKALNLEPDRTIDLINIDCEDHFLTYPLISRVIKKYKINPVFIFDQNISKYDSIFLI